MEMDMDGNELVVFMFANSHGVACMMLATLCGFLMLCEHFLLEANNVWFVPQRERSRHVCKYAFTRDEMLSLHARCDPYLAASI